MAYRLGVDVGGTFTDLLLFDQDERRFLAAQDALDPARQFSVGILTGVDRDLRGCRGHAR